MAVDVGTVFFSTIGDLRVHPVDKWIRASVGDVTVVDSRQARLVWEPRRVVPSYAVPTHDVDGDLTPFSGEPGTELPVRLSPDAPTVLDPRTPFSVHSCPGTPLTIRTLGGELLGAAFAPADDDLAGYVVLDWEAFTLWREEDQTVVGHPHDPFDRIDCLNSSRHVVISVDGQVLADTSSATLLFETPLPMRYYVPRSDVRMDLLRPSSTRTTCAYKGLASYWSAHLGDGELPDIGWSYEEPLHDALPVKGMICFFAERVDLTVDGVDLPRPVTPWS